MRIDDLKTKVAVFNNTVVSSIFKGIPKSIIMSGGTSIRECSLHGKFEAFTKKKFFFLRAMPSLHPPTDPLV